MTSKTDQTNLDERFWGKVERGGEEECWEWQGAINSTGYGSFRFNGKTEAASRVSYHIENGGIPHGLHVLHHCDNRKCVNPDHLFVGTNLDNQHDKVAKGRQAKGETAGRVALDTSDVRFVRAAVRSGFYPSQLAKVMGRGYSTIYNAAHGASWKHIEGAIMPVGMDLVGQKKTITARDLRDATATMMNLVQRGMQITVTKNGAAIVVLSPPQH